MICNETLKIIDSLKRHKINMCPKISSNNYFMNLYKNIKTILQKIELKINNINITILNENVDVYFKNNEFTSENIKEYILNNLKNGYKLEYENNTIIYYTKNLFLPKIIIHIFKIIKLLKILFNRTDYKQKIIYFETNKKKKFPNKNAILGPNEINSGLTFLVNGDIILYRKEELLKVLIHELIHSNLIDEKIIFSKYNKDFSNLFCVNYKILLNEAFTESFATIINLFYIHIINNFKINMLNTMFELEMKYSNQLCLKILDYYNIQNIEDIIKNNNICKNIFPQNTNVFSYYFLKNILLINHIKFGDILQLHTIDYKIADETGIYKIINLIMQNINILNNKHNLLNNSLRLCLYEIKN